MIQNQILLRELLENSTRSFEEINQNVQNYQDILDKFTVSQQKVKELEMALKKKDHQLENSAHDLKMHYETLIEENNERETKNREKEMAELRDEIMKGKIEAEEAMAQKKYELVELESKITELQAALDGVKRQDKQISDLEGALEVKTILIANKEREIARMKNRNEELSASYNKFKILANSPH